VDTLERVAGLQARLIKMLAAQDMQLPMRELEFRLFELTLLLPDLEHRLHTMRPAMLTALLSDTARLAEKLVQLTDVLPGANVSLLVSKSPDILLQVSIVQVRMQISSAVCPAAV
jgi:hypothetical protein